MFVMLLCLLRCYIEILFYLVITGQTKPRRSRWFINYPFYIYFSWSSPTPLHAAKTYQPHNGFCLVTHKTFFYNLSSLSAYFPHLYFYLEIISIVSKLFSTKFLLIYQFSSDSINEAKQTGNQKVLKLLSSTNLLVLSTSYNVGRRKFFFPFCSYWLNPNTSYSYCYSSFRCSSRVYQNALSICSLFFQ